MRPRDLLQRAERMLAGRGELVGVVHLHYPDADEDDDDAVHWRTVDMAKFPPGPKRDALLDGAVVMTGTHEQWLDIMAKEDEEARRAKP